MGRLQMFKAVYDAGEFHLLAEDAEEAAWRAHEHAVNCGWKLIDVISINDDKETLLPKQLESI